MTSASDDELFARYADAARGFGAASRAADEARANEHAGVIAEIYRELRSRGTRHILLMLLDDIDPFVRVWAAAHVLEIDPERGVRVLESLAQLPESVGLSAQMTLREWRAGRLAFP